VGRWLLPDACVQYLPDITVECPTCHGARFDDTTLAAAIDGLTIADVLGLSVHDALQQLAGRPAVAAARTAGTSSPPGRRRKSRVTRPA
jgi:excinuclease UvrABC ATPase subunit